jgi:recombination protein RecT
MAAVKTTRNGEIQRTGNGSGGTDLSSFIERHQTDFARVLPRHMSPDRMVRLALSAVRTTRNLSQCSVVSFASAIMACSTLGLEPNTPLGHAYLIPFRNKGRMECQLVIGYKGFIDLMYRSGIVSSVKCTPVFEGDKFDYEYGLHPDIVHKPGKEPGRYNQQRLTHVYPVIRLKDPGTDPIWDVLTREQIEMRRSRSRAKDSGPWVTDYIAMAMKTGVRSIVTWVPSSAERVLPVAQAVAYEEALERGKPQAALSALGEQAEDSFAQLGTFPMDDENEEDEATSDKMADSPLDPAAGSDGHPEPGADG